MPTRPRTPCRWFACCAIVALELASGPCFAGGADPISAPQAQKNDAQKHYDQGRVLATAQRYPEALAEFKTSFDIVASPNAHFSIARTLASMGQLAEAYIEFGKTIVEARAAAAKDKRYLQTADAADAEQGDLYGKLAFVTITIQNGDNTAVTIGDRPIDREALAAPIPITPGTVPIVVSKGGIEVDRQSVTLATADRKTIHLDARPQAERPAEPPPAVVSQEPVGVAVDTSPGGLRTVSYVAAGVGVVGLATFAIFGSLEKSKFNELNDACHGGPCPPDRADDISAGKSRQMIANVGLAAGVVGIAAGAALFFASAPHKSPTTAHASLVVSPGFVGIGGSL